MLALARQQQEQGNLPGQGKGQNSSSKSKAKNKERKVTTETRQENTRMKRSRRQKQDLYYLHNLETFRNFKQANHTTIIRSSRSFFKILPIFALGKDWFLLEARPLEDLRIVCILANDGEPTFAKVFRLLKSAIG